MRAEVVMLATGILFSLTSCQVFVSVGGGGGVGEWKTGMAARLEARQEEYGNFSSPWLSKFYKRRDFRPAWTGPAGLLGQAHELVAYLAAVSEDGLEPEDYGRTWLQANTVGGKEPNGQLAADLELSLTSAFLELAQHLLFGRIDPRRINEEWQVGDVEADLAGLLQTALDLNRLRETLDSLRPQGQYSQLQQALKRYDRLANQGGWSQVPRSGTVAARRDATIGRLRMTGDLGSEAGTEDQLRAAVEHFQERHGLKVTGAVDQSTREAMNVSAVQRSDQISANLERWRWLPHDLGSRCIVVRIADFEIDLVDGGQVIESMRAIVGRPYRRTPLFSSYMTHVVFQPPWNIPRRIATEELLPAVQMDPDYLNSRGIAVFDGSGNSHPEEDAIDWSRITTDTFTFQFVQDPGSSNPLGRVKFAFPNTFEITLHDTPQKSLFSERVRDFSHGCVRVEDARSLALFTLAKEPSWDRSRVLEAFAGSRTRYVRLERALPVYALYWTVRVDGDGHVQFRDDLYDIDQQLVEALRRERAQDLRRW